MIAFLFPFLGSKHLTVTASNIQTNTHAIIIVMHNINANLKLSNFIS